MDDGYYDRLIEAIRDWCREHNFHEVCFDCQEECKEPYTPWSGQMPPTIYCNCYKEVKKIG